MRKLKRAEQNADRMLAKSAIDGMTVMQNTFRGSEFAQIQAGADPTVALVDWNEGTAAMNYEWAQGYLDY
jgi:hypothetical protein